MNKKHPIIILTWILVDHPPPRYTMIYLLTMKVYFHQEKVNMFYNVQTTN